VCVLVVVVVGGGVRGAVQVEGTCTFDVLGQM